MYPRAPSVWKTRSSAIAERPRDTPCQLKHVIHFLKKAGGLGAVNPGCRGQSPRWGSGAKSPEAGGINTFGVLSKAFFVNTKNVKIAFYFWPSWGDIATIDPAWIRHCFLSSEQQVQNFRGVTGSNKVGWTIRGGERWAPQSGIRGTILPARKKRNFPFEMASFGALWASITANQQTTTFEWTETV